MKYIKKNNNFYILFISFYFTIILGFILNEDTAGGAYNDFIYHLNIRDFFLESNLKGLKNYLDTESIHSPIFIIFLKYLLNQGEFVGRFIFLNICAISPIIFYKALKNKIKINIFYIFYLSNFFFLSPYFRSTSIWPGDENIAILFFLVSIYFYILFIKTNLIQDQTRYIIYNIFFLALSAYFRPIYAIFSIFFFYEFVLKKYNFNNFFIYIFTSLLLSLPAIYYVFVLENTFFYRSISQFNFINTLALFYTTIFFYLIPFIFISIKSFNNLKVDKLNIILTIFFSIIVYKFFNYPFITGGGIIYKAQSLLSSNNLIFTIIFAFSFYLTNIFLEVNKIRNLIIILTLLFFEIDGQFYMESYDPLFLICLFLIFETKIINNFFKNDILKKINILFFYLIMFYCAKLTYIYLL